MLSWSPRCASGKTARPGADHNRFARWPAGTSQEMAVDYLAIYLNDHLAGATAGVELARRVCARNSGDPRFGAPLARLRAEIEADRQTLESVMKARGVRPDPVKRIGAHLAEKLGRLKPNGQLRGYSPLSRVLELEGLGLGITGKLRLWRLLAEVEDASLRGFDFDALAVRAENQRHKVEELQSQAAALL